ncbi:hypothetical protein HOS13_gp10 [Caulobacter phage Lullwater]|uniref:Uncharacterized protein n=1 Tax=Caulobacter phage Lullwater TaxID=2024607 RepID=A0A291LB15_9CAUD|nr:hypothetical protein HOS13_gp10 [Caulobacter phage Lullwater]ATI16317.1 hypothetical protein Lull_010 [Caulobacter phage Lullwater]
MTRSEIAAILKDSTDYNGARLTECQRDTLAYSFGHLLAKYGLVRDMQTFLVECGQEPLDEEDED